MVHIKRYNEMLNEAYTRWNEDSMRFGNRGNYMLSDDTTIFVRESEPDDNIGTIRRIQLTKEAVFDLNEHKDYQLFVDGRFITLDATDEEVVRMCSRPYNLKVIAEGWLDTESPFYPLDTSCFSIRYTDDCDFSDFVRDFNGIKSQFTRRCIYKHYVGFVRSTFLEGGLDKENGYEFVRKS